MDGKTETKNLQYMLMENLKHLVLVEPPSSCKQ